MARQKPTSISNNLQKLKATIRRHRVAANIIGILATLCFIGLLIWFTSFLTTIHNEGERITAVHHEMQVTKTGLQQGLGSSLTDIKEYDSCYHMYQTETVAPPIFPNGVLFCGIHLQGATYNWNDHLPGSNTQWGTVLYINEVILNTFSLSGLTPTLVGNESSEPDSGKPISYQNSFTLYSDQVGCDTLANTDYNDVNYPDIKHDLAGQIYFSLNCYQQSAIDFYPFVPSSLN